MATTHQAPSTGAMRRARQPDVIVLDRLSRTHNRAVYRTPDTVDLALLLQARGWVLHQPRSPLELCRMTRRGAVIILYDELVVLVGANDLELGGAK